MGLPTLASKLRGTKGSQQLGQTCGGRGNDEQTKVITYSLFFPSNMEKEVERLKRALLHSTLLKACNFVFRKNTRGSLWIIVPKGVWDQSCRSERRLSVVRLGDGVSGIFPQATPGNSALVYDIVM